MEYRGFNHKEIEYKLYLGNHSHSSYPLIKEKEGLKDLDILIIESGVLNIKEKEFYNFIQYKEVFENILNENSKLKIYTLDIDVEDDYPSYDGIFTAAIPGIIGAGFITSAIKNKVHNRRDFVKKSTNSLAGLVLLSPLLSSFIEVFNDMFNKENVDADQWKVEINEKLYPSKFISLRNAIVPEIIEKGILSYEKIENPKIGIIYGGHHFGIEDLIKDKKSRYSILNTYNYFIKEHSKELNQVNKITPLGESKFKVETIELNVF